MILELARAECLPRLRGSTGGFLVRCLQKSCPRRATTYPPPKVPRSPFRAGWQGHSSLISLQSLVRRHDCPTHGRATPVTRAASPSSTCRMVSHRPLGQPRTRLSTVGSAAQVGVGRPVELRGSQQYLTPGLRARTMSGQEEAHMHCFFKHTFAISSRTGRSP